jgi:hypothetical protein
MKCPYCLGCFEIVWIKEHKLFWCWLCRKYYEYREDGVLIEVDVSKLEE